MEIFNKRERRKFCGAREGAARAVMGNKLATCFLKLLVLTGILDSRAITSTGTISGTKQKRLSPTAQPPEIIWCPRRDSNARHQD